MHSLFDLDEVFCLSVGGERVGGMLWGAPGIEDRDLMHAGDGAVGGASFFGAVFAAEIVPRILLERNAGVSALLRAVVN